MYNVVWNMSIVVLHPEGEDMNWINAFELICYIIVAIMLVDLIRKRAISDLFTFGAAALVGFTMELLAVSVTDIYYYSTDFWISIGVEPYQFPFFGGLMWGGLTVYGIRLAQKFRCNKLLTGFITGVFVVTMDILLDVVAIRLSGGFWTWVGNPITYDITQKSFMSVIWVNFLGYLIETPTVVFLTLKVREKVKERDYAKQTGCMFLVALGGILVTAAGSLAALLLNAVTDSWFACIAFLVLWCTVMIIIVKRAVELRMTRVSVNAGRVQMLLFWSALYLYCLAGIIYLGIHTTHLWFLILGIAFMIGTLYVCVAEERGK